MSRTPSLRLVLVLAVASGITVGSRRPAALARRHASTALALGVLGAMGTAPAYGGVLDILEGASRANEITYSQNGKNLQRMGRGDYTMGSVQSSTTPKALKRRATMACKSPKVLAELAGADAGLDEKTCTISVLDGEGIDRVLAALAALGSECNVDATHVCL